MISRQARSDWEEILGGEIGPADRDYVRFFENDVVEHSDNWSEYDRADRRELREDFWNQFGYDYVSAHRTRAHQDYFIEMMGIDPEIFWNLWSDFYSGGR